MVEYVNMTLAINTKLKRKWEWREYKSGSLIENGIALNETGTFIWKKCDGKTTIKDIAKAVEEKFDISENQAEKDVNEFIALLISENALD